MGCLEQDDGDFELSPSSWDLNSSGRAPSVVPTGSMKKIWDWVTSVLGTGRKKSHLTNVVSSHHEAEEAFPGGFVAGGIWANCQPQLGSPGFF